MNSLDKLRSWLSPTAALDIAQKRAAVDTMSRAYEALSQSRRSSGGWTSIKSGASAEASKAYLGLAEVGQELCRNNPLAIKIKHLVGNNIVGDGIKPALIGSNKNTSKAANEALKSWAESTQCDFNGKYNFYGLQWLIAVTVAECGGAFIIKRFNRALKVPLQLQVIEQTHLDDSKQMTADKSGDYITDGIVFNRHGQVKGYWLKPNTNRVGLLDDQSVYFDANEVRHVYDKTRSDQHLGLSWFAPIANTLKDRGEFKDAKLVQQKVAACFAAIITGAKDGDNVGYEDDDDERITHVEPAMVQYMNEDADVKTINPPKADNSTEFETTIDRDIAAGAGFTYEQLTGDYSKVNFASGRMGRSEFYNQLDHWQQHVFKPDLDVVISDWWCGMYRMNTGALNCRTEWTYPVRASVNPKEELEVTNMKVRNGYLSRSQAAKLYGGDWVHTNDQWRLDDEPMQDNAFDNDPRLFSLAGNQLNSDDAASANREGAKPATDDEKDDDSENA